MANIECEHGEPRGAEACALCRYAANQAKEQGIQTSEQVNPEWQEQARAEIMRLARTGAPFTIEDVCDVVGLPGGSNKAVGAIMNRVARTGMIYKYGQRPATRITSHRRTLQVWRGGISQDPREQQDTLWA